MRRILAISCVLSFTIATATPSDDLRHAIITSNLKEVVKLLPSISEQEKATFVQLADTILKNRYHDYYEVHRIIPKVSFPMILCLATGIATCFGFSVKAAIYKFKTMFFPLEKVSLQVIQVMLKDPGIREQLQIAGAVDLTPAFVAVNQAETSANISRILSKMGIAAGAGLIATSVWLGFRNMQNLHDLYTNALEIKYTLAQETPSAAAAI